MTRRKGMSSPTFRAVLLLLGATVACMTAPALAGGADLYDQTDNATGKSIAERAAKRLKR